MYFFIISILLLTMVFVLSKKRMISSKLLIIVNSIISAIYIGWRFTTIPTTNFISFSISILLLMAELLGLTQFLIFEFLFSHDYKLKRNTLSDLAEVPIVDVLICTYNEPLSLLEKTIVASINMKYPKDKLKIHICDDGRRNDLKEMCKSYNINYITRNENKGAKAGNINNALSKINGELFAVFDADMIPNENFLQKTIGYFSDEKTAFVQTPQVYYNQDMYQYNLKRKIPNEQDFFMRDIQEARASINAVLHVGTNAVFRRKYVDEIGGYPTSSITEDMAVGMLLQNKGYRSVFINEVLALGLSATTYSELVKQRDRWCRGNLQVMKQFNPIRQKGLTIAQKIAYVDGVVYWFSSIQKIVYILCPIIYLLTALPIINANSADIIKYFIPFFLGEFFAFNVLSSKTRKLKWAHFYEVAMAPYISFSIMREMLFFKTNFNVTTKDAVNEKSYFQFSLAMPYIIISALTILSWIIGFILLKYKFINLGSYAINVLWSAYNFIGTLLCIKVSYQKPIFRKGERTKVHEDIIMELTDKNMEKEQCLLYDISYGGMGITLSNSKVALDENVTLNFKYKDRVSTINGKVVRVDKNFVGIKFEDLKIEEKINIIRIYVNNLKPYYEIDKEQVYIEKID